jgi:DNA-binding MarR family transcriptional regulator
METLIRKSPLPSRGSEPGRSGANGHKGPADPTKHAVVTMHPRRLLLGAARQSGIGDPDSCRIILSILYAGRAVRRALRCDLDHEFGFQDSSGAGFATLVTLYALSPLPATAADLAYHAEVGGAAMADIIEALERRGLVVRHADGRDRITLVDLTERGQQAAVLAVRCFLEVASDLARGIGPPIGDAVAETCEQVESRAADTGS